jgi:hypothetical protein
MFKTVTCSDIQGAISMKAEKFNGYKGIFPRDSNGQIVREKAFDEYEPVYKDAGTVKSFGIDGRVLEGKTNEGDKIFRFYDKPFEDGMPSDIPDMVYVNAGNGFKVMARYA